MSETFGVRTFGSRASSCREMDNANRHTPKVLTTDEIRKLAGDWSLAGDVGLLAHLEQLSESIFDRTKETQKHFDELVDEYEDTFAQVGNITNQFLTLQNCQFVENRVYDEETPTEEKPFVEVQDEAEQERLLLLNYKEAVEIGVKLLDTHFQEVQLPPNSDSDEEDEITEGNSVIWKPKNPYAGKKFPLLIGSAEWWADDHVGLRENEENLETEKIVSESESDFESLKSTDKKVKSSSSSASSMENLNFAAPKSFLESSSEDLFGLHKNDKVSNSAEFSSQSSSLLKEPVSFLPDLEIIENGPEVDPVQEIEPPKIEAVEEEAKKPRKVDNAFTRELTAKLNSVTSKNNNEEKEKSQKPLARNVKPEESLFDETDDASDLFSTKVDSVPVREKELFFDVDNDDHLFKGSKDLFSGSTLFENEALKSEKKSALKEIVEPVVTDTKKPEEPEKEANAPKKRFVENLFEDLDDDDTLFATTSAEKSIFTSSISPAKKPFPVATELGWDNDEGLFDSINNVIDDDFLKASSILDPQPKLDFETKNSDESKGKESDDIFESEATRNDLFGSAPTEKVGDPEDDDLFSVGFKSSVKIEDDSSLFGDKPKQLDSVSISSSRSSLFDDVNVSKTRLASVFQKEPAKAEDLFNPSESDKSTKKSLFDDECGDGDDLFGEKSLFESKNEKSKLFDESPEVKESKTNTAKENLVHDVDDGELFGKWDRKVTPPSSLSLPEKSVRKLNIPDNLKSRFESAAKHISPGGVKPSFKEEDTTSKEEAFEPSNLLKCPNKDRVKIPGRRRPQSRRARQEAIRHSGIWEQPRSPPVSSPNPLSPSTDEEDFFKVPELDTNYEKEDQSIFERDLFESKPEDGVLFDEPPVLSPKKPEFKTANLFDDDDDNLFSASPKQIKVAEMKKSLFEADLDEDDDLFGGKASATPSKTQNIEKPKESTETKEKGNSSFVDPLGLISSDD